MAYVSYLAIAAAVALLFHQLYSAHKARQLQRLLHIPHVKFDHDDTQAHYITSTKEVLHKGYVQVRDTAASLEAAS